MMSFIRERKSLTYLFAHTNLYGQVGGIGKLNFHKGNEGNTIERSS